MQVRSLPVSQPDPASSVRPSRRSFVKALAALPLAGAFGPFNIHIRAADSNSPFATDNEVITRARNAALAILKPSAKEIDQGFKIHAEALVFESYGFAPRAALDGDRFQAAVASGASDRELVDLREECGMTRWAIDPKEREEFLEAMRAAGVTCVFQNTGEESSNPLQLMKRLARFTFATDLAPDVCFKAAKPDDIVAAKRDGRRCLYFTTNGVPLHQQWDNVREELQHIRIFQELGVRMMHLTYNRRNQIGDGAGEPNDGGLSDFGHTVVGEMNRLGVIVDVAHSGWRTAREAAKASKRPMVASHTTCAGLFKHFRGKPDDTVSAICDTGGLIGICCIPRFLGGKGDISSFLDHIDYAVKKFGADHVAIGVDTGYGSRNDAKERAKVKARSDGRSPLSVSGPRWEHLWPVDPFQQSAQGVQSLAWTNWPIFTIGMVQRGHSEETIRKILGENTLRVARANWNPTPTGPTKVPPQNRG